MFEIEFDDTVIIFPVNQIDDGAAHNMMSGPKDSKLKKLPYRGLATFVGPDDADLRALVELQVDVVQHGLGGAGEGCKLTSSHRSSILHVSVSGTGIT